MKKYNIILAFVFVLFSFMACEDEDPTAVLKSDITESTLQTLPNTSYVLLEENETNLFDPFVWTATDFGINTPVTYTLEMDTAGNNFADATPFLTLINEVTDTFTIKEFNTVFLNAGFKPELETSVEIRVAATIGANYDPVYSNSIGFTVTAFNAFDPIYMIGDGVGGWDPGLAVEITGIAANKYETIATFENGKHFRFFKEADWGAEQWGYDYFTGDVTSYLAPEESHDDPNYRVEGETGDYRITVDLDAKSIEMVPVTK